MKTPILDLISELETIKNTKCKTLQEIIFFDGVLAVIESRYVKKENDHINMIKNSAKKNAIDFAVYLTGRDKETIEQMYKDWKK